MTFPALVEPSSRTPRRPRAARRALAVAGVVGALVGLSAVSVPAQAQTGAMSVPTSGRVVGIVGGHCSTPGDGHGGIDVAAALGTPVRAAAAGTVSIAGTMAGSESYGTFVRVHHAGDYRTIYAHLSKLAVRKGQPVTKGQVIGYVGSTGHSSGPHLHFEVRLHNVRQTGPNASFPCRSTVTQGTPIRWSFPGLGA